MTNLLVFKEHIKKFYSNNEIYIMPAMKFLLAGLSLLLINVSLGFMDKINNPAIVLIVALMCSFLPTGCILFFSALFILLHFYALALEIAVVALAVFLVMFLLYFRFSTKDTLLVLLTPICFVLKIPYVMPLAAGLLGTPASAISIGCGVIVYYLVSYVSTNATALKAMEAGEAVARFRMVIDSILGNKEMIIVVAAFAITVIVVYIIRRSSIDFSWTTAIISGAILDMVIILAGALIYDTSVSVIGVMLGSAVSILLAKVVQFLALNLDYSRKEKVQFEDDEYYYYVKAVPKITVSAPTKTVKKINTQHHTVAGQGRSAHRNTAQRRTGTGVRETDWER